MQAPELRLVRYWVAVAEERNITRAVIATLATSYVVMLVYLIGESAPRR